MDSYSVVWLVFTILFLVLEIATVNLVSIWFVFGGIAAFICSMMGASLGIQIGFFVLVSAVLLIFTMPVARRMIANKKIATNADRVIKQQGIVTETINVTEGTGKIKVMGSIWSAKSSDGSIIPEGENVYVTDISGVHAVVKKI